jgi:pimeloyl-ACP methyl ester carboxylesterase
MLLGWWFEELPGVSNEEELTMPSITANNVKLNYIEQGAGDETIVFVHGLTGSIGEWREVLARLPKEYHILALDQRGHGGSDKPGSYQLAELADDFYAFIRELGIGLFTYVGHSMGGTLGLRFALDHPDMLKALVLVAHFPVHEWMTPETAGPLLAMTGADDIPTAFQTIFGSPEMLRGNVGQMFATPPSEEVLNEVVNDAIATDLAAVGDCYSWMLSSGLEPRLGDISVPTLIVAGAKDPTPPNVQGLDANAIEGCRFEVFEDAGHFIPYESPQKLVDLLTSFIKDVSPGYKPN